MDDSERIDELRALDSAVACCRIKCGSVRGWWPSCAIARVDIGGGRCSSVGWRRRGVRWRLGSRARGWRRWSGIRKGCPLLRIAKSFIAAIQRHYPVIIVAGETGSGKTTQLPKFCLEAGLGVRARIGCTQPRRVAALSIARRLAEETRGRFRDGRWARRSVSATTPGRRRPSRVMTDDPAGGGAGGSVSPRCDGDPGRGPRAFFESRFPDGPSQASARQAG